MSDLVFEIGCEELPPHAAPKALEQLADEICRRLGQARLTHGDVQRIGTPRRLGVIVEEVQTRQASIQDTVTGPPVSAGTRAAEGFAKKHGVTFEQLAEQDGRFVLSRNLEGQSTFSLLPEILVSTIRHLSWPKPMRWAEHDETFGRPVLWLLALFDGEVIPAEFAGVKAKRETFGHRFSAPGPYAVADANAYLRALEDAHVVADVALRKERIVEQLHGAASEIHLRVRSDDELLEEVAWLCEEPTVLVGSFHPDHLELPEAVVVSAMRNHQRYFALEDASGRLTNQFLVVAATRVRDPQVVRRGNERVLAARLADARFFYQEDRKQRLVDRVEKLRDVVFQSKLGTVYQKVERVAGLGIMLAQKFGVDPEPVARAARLLKADLVTYLVYEFPELAGQIGSVLARAEGESEEVAQAIYEHTLPRFASDVLPKSQVGAILSLADRLDTLIGCFGVELQPTGTADPYGLRRAAIGVLRVLIDRDVSVSLSDLLKLAAARYQGQHDAAVPKVAEFLRGRLRAFLAENYPTDLVEAVHQAGGDDVVDLRARVAALAELRKRPDFEPLAITFKRVANILKGEVSDGAVDERLLSMPAEQELWREVSGLLGGKTDSYESLLASLARLKPAVDRFFDDVLVMDENLSLRQNRLVLLGRLNGIFRRVADFRQIEVC